MIRDFFSTEGKYVQIMGRMFDLIVLNVLLIVCSIPLVTMGAAITAVYDMSLRMLRNEENSIVKGFFRSFRGNFRKATLIWFLFLIIAGISYGDLEAGKLLSAYGLQLPLSIVGGIQLALALVLMPYLFSLTARFENTIGATFKNGFLLAIAHIPASLFMLVLGTSGIWFLLWVPMPDKILYSFISILFLFWFALCIHWNGKQIHKIFQMHFASEEPE